MSKKIIVGISGGVDSAVSAYLLTKQGYEVIGVTFIMWKNDDGSVPEYVQRSIDDAMKIAQVLNIQLDVIDATVEFKDNVIDYFATEYISGRTPNPCVICNRTVKFDMLLKVARKRYNAELIATGHYAKVIYIEETQRYSLQNADFDNKDQTYALFNLTQEQLRHIVFPLGRLEKKQVREIAKEANLPVATKTDSQEICFIPNDDYVSYICNHYNYTPKIGNFIFNEKIVEKHKGIIHYTVGQRRGLGISATKPLYVKNIDTQTNDVILSTEDELYTKSTTVKDVNWMSVNHIDETLKVDVKIRYSAKKQSANITPLDDNRVYVVFDKPVRSITPGQAAVFYNNDIVLGGGIIS